MYQAIKVPVPHTTNPDGDVLTLSVDTDKLPVNVRQRLIELGLTAAIRSTVNSARSTEYDKAETAAREAHKKAQAAALKKDAKYEVVTFNSEAFAKAFTHTTDLMAAAAERVAEYMAGTIRAARGQSGTSKLLAGAVRSNILTVLKGKGKGHKEAVAMIGDDPFAFIEKTARKRAGEGEGSDERFAVELAKLNAQYVDPARALLAPDEPAAEGEEGAESAADDLI